MCRWRQPCLPSARAEPSIRARLCGRRSWYLVMVTYLKTRHVILRNAVGAVGGSRRLAIAGIDAPGNPAGAAGCRVRFVERRTSCRRRIARLGGSCRGETRLARLSGRAAGMRIGCEGYPGCGKKHANADGQARHEALHHQHSVWTAIDPERREVVLWLHRAVP